MIVARAFRWLIAVALFSVVVGRAADEPAPAHPLVWDAMEKHLDVKPGDTVAEFEFNVTNRSAKPVEIQQLRPTCGCTTTDLPRKPWILAPGEHGSFRATVEFAGKTGKFSKSIYVTSTAGTQMLQVSISVPEGDSTERKRNQELAAANRQLVFRGSCAACHSDPIGQKTGAELFHTACGICHFAAPRASVVPDLLTAREPRDAAFWRKWISEGKEGTLMPAFAQAQGGPLTDQQIESLIEFALASLPTQPRKE